MPFSSKLTRIREAELEERAQEKANIEEQMLAIHTKLEPYYSSSWDHFQALLLTEQQNAFKDIMNADAEGVMLARERAKLVSRLLRVKEDLEQDLSRLRAERSALEEE